jgi:hypothetical protein
MNLHAKIFCSVLALTCACVDGAFAKPKPEYKSKLSGYEFGAGVPLVTPLTGYNFFVGYVNKDASTFLGRRFGIRADFTIPSTLQLKGTLSDSDELSDDGKKQYQIDATAKVLGIKLKSSDFTDEKLTIERFEDDSGGTDSTVSIGQNAADVSLDIKNENMGLLVDFYPFGDTWFLGGIRFSGGYYLGDLDVSANVKINNDIEYRYRVGHAGDYIRAQIQNGSRIGADFHWKYHGPYAGLGFDIGIYRGFKFFVDAGVVFANRPHVDDSNVHDQDFVLNGCYEINGQPCQDSEMVELLHGINPPNVRNIVHDTVGIAVRNTLAAEADKYSSVIAAIPGFENADTRELANQLGDNIMAFLDYDGTTQDYVNDTNTNGWVKTLLTDSTLVAQNDNLLATVDDIKSEWQENVQTATDGIQADINQAYDDYQKEKHDAIDDINDFFKDYSMVPMVKIGFMYRF